MRSSSRLIVRPSRTLTTICTYGKTREFTGVDSSSTRPSTFNVSCSNIVELFLVRSALSRLIVLPTPRVGTLATVVLSAAKGTAKILPAGVAGMSEETNSAVATLHCAVLQLRMIAQDAIQRHLILTDKRVDAVVLVPILAKSKNFRDRYDKRARFSVIMLSLSTTSSYLIDAKASRGRAGYFSWIRLATRPTGPHQPSKHYWLPKPPLLPNTQTASHVRSKRLLGKEKTHTTQSKREPQAATTTHTISSFQVVGQ